MGPAPCTPARLPTMYCSTARHSAAACLTCLCCDPCAPELQSVPCMRTFVHHALQHLLAQQPHMAALRCIAKARFRVTLCQSFRSNKHVLSVPIRLPAQRGCAAYAEGGGARGSGCVASVRVLRLPYAAYQNRAPGRAACHSHPAWRLGALQRAEAMQPTGARGLRAPRGQARVVMVGVNLSRLSIPGPPLPTGRLPAIHKGPSLIAWWRICLKNALGWRPPPFRPGF